MEDQDQDQDQDLHSVSPRRTQPNNNQPRLNPSILLLICATLFGSISVPSATATATPVLADAIPFELMDVVGLGPGGIMFDNSVSLPADVAEMLPLQKRAAAEEDSSEGAAAASATFSEVAVAATSTSAASALPSPFDMSLGNNFTDSACPAFFNGFLADETFKSCLPLSLLLQTSNSFFVTERSTVLLTQTLDATCSVNITLCSAYMASLARDIQSEKTCGADLSAQNPTVMQAYAGFVAYNTLYSAGCLKAADTGDYCFVDAATNASAATSSYVYFLPLGVALPDTAAPTCSRCLQETMALFQDAAANSSQPVSGLYASAAEQIDGLCGADFVNTTVAVTSAAARISRAGTQGSWMAWVVGFTTFAAAVL